MDRPNVYKDWIVGLCDLLRPATYLEIGCQDGNLVYRVAPFVGKAIGVDLVDGEWAHFDNTEFYVSNSFDFFRTYKDTADIIFIDADHSFLRVYADCLQALKHLRDNGIIMLHDTWPFDESATAKELCGTAYKAVRMIRRRQNIDVLTMPFMHGLTLVTRRPEWHR